MRLNPLLRVLDRDPSFATLVEALRTPGAGPQLLSAITPARAYALAALHGALNRPVLLVVGRPFEARGYVHALRAWARDPETALLFPVTAALPYTSMPDAPDR